MIVFEQYFAGLTHPTWGENPVTFDAHTPHVLSSVTKSFTATLLGIAIDRGFISSVEERVFDYYPELAALDDGLKREITLEHLVTMSAGLAWNESSTTLRNPGNDLTAMIRIATTTSDDMVRFILGKPLEHPPGTRFLYSGGLTNVLGNVIGRATGQLLDQFSEEFLFSPLEIDRFWWWLLRPDFVYASGDLALRPRDMVRFGQLFLQNGQWNGEQIVSEEWVRLSATPRFEFTEPHWAVSYGHRGYSYGWWPSTEEYGDGAFAASGWGGQAIIVVPEYDMVVAVTGGYYWDAPFLTYNQLMTNYIIPAIQ
jgi:CubicO group peptidase (beta-lactamase class C family)